MPTPARLGTPAVNSSAGSNTCSVSYTRVSGSDRLVRISIAYKWEGTQRTISSVTDDGVGATLLTGSGVTVSAGGEGVGVLVYYVKESALSGGTGSKTATVTFNAATHSIAVTVQQYEGVDQATTFRAQGANLAVTSAGAGGTSRSVNVASVADDLVCDILEVNGGTPTVGAGQTQRSNVTGTGGPFSADGYTSDEVATGASTTMSWTVGDDFSALAAFALIGAEEAPAGYTMTASVGSFALTGIAAGLRAGRAIAAAVGSFALAGQAAGLLRSRRLAAETGVFALVGQGTDLLADRAMPAAVGVFALAGLDAGLHKGFRLSADAGAFALAGSDVDFPRGYGLAAEPGAFLLAGATTDFPVARRLVAATGAFTLTGIDAGLSKTGAFVLAAETGAFALTGDDADLLRGLLLSADAGVFAFAGIDVDLRRAYTLGADPGAFILTGTDATLTKTGALSMAAEPGTFTLAGLDTGLRTARLLPAGLGAFTLTGIDAALLRGYGMAAGVGSFALTGIDAGFVWHRRLTAGVGAFVLVGVPVTLTFTGLDTLNPYRAQWCGGSIYVARWRGGPRYLARQVS